MCRRLSTISGQEGTKEEKKILFCKIKQLWHETTHTCDPFTRPLLPGRFLEHRLRVCRCVTYINYGQNYRRAFNLHIFSGQHGEKGLCDGSYGRFFGKVLEY